MQTGRIINSNSGFYYIQTADKKIVTTKARGNFRQRKIKPLVGDWVDFDNAYLLNIHPRRNEIARPLIANVDQALVVVSATEPEFSTNLLDRFIVILQSKNIKPIIYLSKTDLLSSEQLVDIKQQLDYYHLCGYEVFTSHQSEIEEKHFMAVLGDQETVVTGQTGVGKSTLLNKLLPELKLKTASISTSLNRGKHTTRLVTLYPFQNGLIADTPGFSSLQFQDITVEQLPNLFRDLQYYASDCKYRSCLHLNEPDCAVKKAVTSGDILPSRYQNYQQFHEEIAKVRPTYQKKSKKRR
ncbi:ribosome small subunit-dependent GTPase A [Bombilactobacillus thymidiniphilus]|uniref:Small ribosomal subunit biogenesis GTPase RsgA n=1 Tax=Bombilactobacillus thymidiniphilus TaxID=2923363 RepID=A0ABY4PD72_9LACO|nr:ribosome small subunit-dependent GTPase A [Bombilactobacillus thymidiniphilus]UQS83461.1 ribosome small subunit-dependent GTPase A [Bombilactobacillus thymidiniphilus]